MVFAARARARPEEIADVFWEFMAMGALTTASRARPDEAALGGLPDVEPRPPS